MPIPDPEIGIESCFVVEAAVGGGCPGAGGTSGCFSETIGNCVSGRPNPEMNGDGKLRNNIKKNMRFNKNMNKGFANRRGFRGDWALRVRNRHYCCSNHDHLWFKKPIGGNITEEQEGGVNGGERAATPMAPMDSPAMALNRSKGEPVR
ncbi:hypothetical protein L2E82_38850 [Cichorium intybus]|uniref:Uncharacterized protein n=1 Tax=Cichorium intybus TaxID=13427 RepID=A0ACB9AGV1_CICIN|nr:hypothetical protein L2E82_38850 [Cichorium intybus]